MRGERSRALLYIVRVNGRACSGSELSNMTQKAALGDWRGEIKTVTGEIQTVTGVRRCRKEEMRTEEMF